MPRPRAIGLIVFLCWLPAVSAAPPLIHYQGLALDASGNPIATPVAVAFSLFSQPQGGTAIWFETHAAVQPVDGVFSLLLGSVAPFPADAFAGDDRWLQVNIGGETLQPRQRLASVPWALRAGCEPNDVLHCYAGPPETLGVGTCAAGRRICAAGGSWGSCAGAIGPAAEVCGDQLDNDCDGEIDNGCGVCGDGLLDDGEACDDGNLVGGDGCSASCQPEVCGNGIWDVGEQCDDGNLIDGDGCSSDCVVDDAQVAPPDANFNSPLDIPLDTTVSVLDFVSHPGGDTQDRVRYQVLGMNANPSFPGGQARLVISATCFGTNTDQLEFFTAGNSFSCGQTIVDRSVTADTDTGTITVTAVGGAGTYVQWVLTGSAVREN